jgi:hypothetical protein
MDTFAKVVLLTAVIMVAVLGAIVVLGFLNADNIPDSQTGIVYSKDAVSDGNGTYMVKLYDGQVFYVLNGTLYDAIILNQTYTFTNHINFYEHRTIVDSIQIQSGTVMSKQVISGGNSTYAVTLGDGRTLYVLKTDVYGSLNLGQTYVLTLKIDTDKSITSVDAVTVQKIPNPPS